MTCRLIGFSALDTAEGPGFFLPLFADDTNKIFIQIVSSSSNKCVGFSPIQDTDESIIFIDTKYQIDIGHDIIFVYIDSNKLVHHGTLVELNNILRLDLVNGAPKNVALQIADLLLTGKDRSVHRSASLSDIIKNNAQNVSYLALSNSMAVQVLWDTILNSIKSPLERSTIEQNRHAIMISADFSSEKLLPDSLWNQISDKLTISLEFLRDKVLLEVPLLSSSFATSFVNHGPVTYSELEPINALKILTKSGRQERRIAIILRKLIEDYEIGIYLLAKHKDRGKFARNAIDIIRNVNLEIAPGNDLSRSLSALIPKFYSLTFPMNRGELLFIFAEELGHIPHFAKEIEKKLNMSNSMYVRWIKAAASARLQEKSSQGPA